MIKFITDTEIYTHVIQDMVLKAKKFIWLGTSDLKDMYVTKGQGIRKSRKMVPFLEILSDLIEKNVMVRLLHAKEPGKNFRNDFDKYKNLIEGLEQIVCPRVHFKSIIVDGKLAYSGSANITGAGMGAKSSNRRNFEAGFITDDSDFITQIMNQFDDIWMGKHCLACQRKEYCNSYEEMLL